ncbi:MAG TPA: cyclic-di-AMP receptor [Anaerolineales bacterium]
MKMMIVIVKDQDADGLTQKLTAGSYRVTRIASTGGLLRSGVVTLLIGLEDDQVDAAIDLIRARLSPASHERRATLFVVPVARFEQI